MLSRKLQREIEARLYQYDKLDPSSPTDAKWLEVIDATIRQPNRWSFYRQWYRREDSPVAIAMRLHCDKRTLYRWREELLFDIALRAAYWQLIEP